MENPRKHRSFFWPLLLIAVGVLILLVNMGVVKGSTWDNLLLYWPVILIIGGLDGLIKGDGWVGPLVLLGLGSVLLLGNLNYLTMDAFGLLLRLWPVLLVAIGLDIAFGKRKSAWNSLLRIGLGLLLVSGIVWVAISSPLGRVMKEFPVEQPLQSATSSKTSFMLNAGKLSLSGGAPADILVTGKAILPGNSTIDWSYKIDDADDNGVLLLDGRQGTMVPFINTASPWTFKLNSTVPTDLNTMQLVGDLQVDLTGMEITSLTSDTTIGRMVLTLPCEADLAANLKVAIGEVEIRVPKGCDLKVNLDGGLTAVSLPVGYLKVDDHITNQGITSASPALTMNLELAIGRLIIMEID